MQRLAAPPPLLPFPSASLPSPNRIPRVDVGGRPSEREPRPLPAHLPRGRPAPPPGYAEPLKSVPPEKFNHTVIPKGYRSPWQEFVNYRDYQSDVRGHTPRPAEYRNFNK